jgi:hypothetical protein
MRRTKIEIRQFQNGSGELKDARLFDSLPAQANRAAEDTPASDDLEKARYFITNTGRALDEITQSEDAEIQLEFISLMVNGGSVGEMADMMAQISEEMSLEYLQAVESQIANMDAASGSRQALSSGDIRNIRLGFHGVGRTNSARIALDQSSMNVYYGFCAVTVAGLSAYKWCKWRQPWVGVAGLITAAAGGASMAIELGLWYACADFQKFLNNLITAVKNEDKNALATANGILQSGMGGILLQITVATGGVVGFAFAATPEVAWAVVNVAKNTWNSIARDIQAALKFTPVIRGIPITTMP